MNSRKQIENQPDFKTPSRKITSAEEIWCGLGREGFTLDFSLKFAIIVILKASKKQCQILLRVCWKAVLTKNLKIKSFPNFRTETENREKPNYPNPTIRWLLVVYLIVVIVSICETASVKLLVWNCSLYLVIIIIICTLLNKLSSWVNSLFSR